MSRFKSLLNTAVERVVIDGVNQASTFVAKNPQTAAIVLAGVHATKEKITKDTLIKIGKKSVKSGAFCAAIDGAMGVRSAHKHYNQGQITKSEYVRHVAQEAGCGFVSSSAGTSGTLLATALLGASGTAPLLIGMGTSIGVRYLYRNLVPPAYIIEEEDEDDEDEDLDGLIRDVTDICQRG